MNNFDWTLRVIVFNTTFNNISVILAKETREPEENHRQTLSHNVASNAPHHY